MRMMTQPTSQDTPQDNTTVDRYELQRSERLAELLRQQRAQVAAPPIQVRAPGIRPR